MRHRSVAFVAVDVRHVGREGGLLGKMLDTLPERLALAKNNKLANAAFLELVLADEVDRRDRTGAIQRAHAAGLDGAMTLETAEDRRRHLRPRHAR